MKVDNDDAESLIAHRQRLRERYEFSTLPVVPGLGVGVEMRQITQQQGLAIQITMAHQLIARTLREEEDSEYSGVIRDFEGFDPGASHYLHTIAYFP